MKHYTTNKRYCPHEITTKLNSVQLYRQTKDISYVCRKYKISKASLMRWNKAYDGTKASLMPKSHRPHSPHPNAHTEQELKWIKDYHRRNPISSLAAKLSLGFQEREHQEADCTHWLTALYLGTSPELQYFWVKSPFLSAHLLSDRLLAGPDCRSRSPAVWGGEGNQTAPTSPSLATW